MGNQKDDEGETSEDFCQEDLNIGRYTGKDRGEWCSNDIKGMCVIFCGNTPF